VVASLIGPRRVRGGARLARVAPASRLREALEGLALLGRERDLRRVSGLFCLQTFTRGCFTVFAVGDRHRAAGHRRGRRRSAHRGTREPARCSDRSPPAALLVGDAPFARWSGAAVALWGLPFVILAAVSGQWLALAPDRGGRRRQRRARRGRLHAPPG
jgi:hypothetical protein